MDVWIKESSQDYAPSRIGIHYICKLAKSVLGVDQCHHHQELERQYFTAPAGFQLRKSTCAVMATAAVTRAMPVIRS